MIGWRSAKVKTCTSIWWNHKNQSKWSSELCQFAVWWHREQRIAPTTAHTERTRDKKKEAHKQIGETTVIILARFSAEDKVSKLTKHERDGETKSNMNKKKNVTADAFAMCTLRVHAHCPSLTLGSSVQPTLSSLLREFVIMRFALRFSLVFCRCWHLFVESFAFIYHTQSFHVLITCA